MKKDGGIAVPDFTHFDADGRAIMVDVTDKPVTAREAVAAGRIRMNPAAFEALCAGTHKKGDVLAVARIAGIMAVKQTAGLIPLCHPVATQSASVDFALCEAERAVVARCRVRTSGKTGVEMEALTGVSVALLTVYDMCKALDKAMEIQSIHLEEKRGGRSGEYRRGEQAPEVYHA